jgi:uncharacterized protein YndB with AHSA1/START domain
VVAVRRQIEAPPEAVWDVLSDGWLYPSWVVGASRMRAVDAHWPEAGAELHHSVGAWPVLLNDTTSVLRSAPNSVLVLRARGWPMGEAGVELRLEPRGSGCEVLMLEDVVTGPTKVLPGPVRTGLIGPRNAETLQRLAYIAEGRSR